MSEFVESKATGKYPSGLPYTSFHKRSRSGIIKLEYMLLKLLLEVFKLFFYIYWVILCF